MLNGNKAFLSQVAELTAEKDTALSQAAAIAAERDNLRSQISQLTTEKDAALSKAEEIAKEKYNALSKESEIHFLLHLLFVSQHITEHSPPFPRLLKSPPRRLPPFPRSRRSLQNGTTPGGSVTRQMRRKMQ